MLKPGCVPATIYFRHLDGHLSLAPFSDCPTPPDAIREYADTVPAVRKLEAILVNQELEKMEKENQMEYERYKKYKDALRDRLYQRSISAATSQIEKDYIKGILELQDERKVKYYNEQLAAAQSYHLHALHYDLGDRDAGKEEVNLDKINF